MKLNPNLMRRPMGLGACLVAAIIAISIVGYGLASQRDSDPAATPAPLSEVVAAAQASAQGAQAAALSDGVISWDEHEAALSAVASCLASAGVAVEVRPAEGRKPTEIGFSAVSIEEGEAARAKLEDCKTRHLAAIEDVWQAQNWLTPAQEDTILAWLGQCVKDAGVSLDTSSLSNATLMSLQRDGSPAESSAVTLCIEKRKVVFGQ
ncbi:MAG: hypothetical protein HYX53_14855 [Chloroflexi bacterium]|nr:hypothetical protein [Chloroflexota bacterium]